VSADAATAHAGESAAIQRVRRLPGAGSLVDWGPVRHAGSAARLGTLVRETGRFAAADLLGLSGIRRYHLRLDGRSVLLRHGTIDSWTLAEIFVRRLYDPPPAVAEALAAVESPLVVDMGANIGMFGLHALSRYPGARIVAYEPDARNAAIHRRVLELNALGERWELVEACAGAQDGVVRFLAGLETGSHAVDGREPGSVEVPQVDVLPLLAQADLVKMDIEGAEWEIMDDPRFGMVGSAVIEYHPRGCPGDDPAASARDLLRSHGFTVTPVFHDASGIGMLWASRA
jgi:FkbM family methyltransferase